MTILVYSSQSLSNTLAPSQILVASPGRDGIVPSMNRTQYILRTLKGQLITAHHGWLSVTFR